MGFENKGKQFEKEKGGKHVFLMEEYIIHIFLYDYGVERE